MKIIVRNNDAVKAYKIMMKKLDTDGFFKELKTKKHYLSKSNKKREKRKYAMKRHKKLQIKRDEIFEKQEKQILIASKRRAKAYKAEHKNQR